MDDRNFPAEDDAAGYRHSSYREKIIEHAFVSEVLRRLWAKGVRNAEILKPEVDGGGYDIVLRAGRITRHVQLKSLTVGARTSRWKIGLSLGQCPSGCVVVIVSDPAALDIGPFLWFGGVPGAPLPPIDHLPVARHTKGDATGLKAERQGHRVVKRGQFKAIPDVDTLLDRLFGAHPERPCAPASMVPSIALDPPLRHVWHVLAMVHELHKAGYQGLRISAGLAPSGCHWRCEITTADNIADNGWEILKDGPDVAAYTTADEGRYFGWADAAGATPRDLAGMFVARFPGIATRGAGQDWPYAGWLVSVLGAVERGRVPIFYADHDLEEQALPLPPAPRAYA